MLRERIKAELDELTRLSSGLLLPANVVEFAKDPATALHSQFTWDDSTAAHAHRLWQARQVIRLHVVVIEGTHEPVRAFVSISSDRVGGGYRPIVSVIGNDIQREQMLRDALDDLNRIKAKYKALAALRPVWEALATVSPSDGDVRAAG